MIESRAARFAVIGLIGLAGAAWSCRRSEPARQLVVDAAEAPRPRPAQLAHVTLKVLGMT